MAILQGQIIDIDTDPFVLRNRRGRDKKPIPQYLKDVAETLVAMGDAVKTIGTVSHLFGMAKSDPVGTDKRNATLHGSRIAIVRSLVAQTDPTLFVQGRIVLYRGAPFYGARVERIEATNGEAKDLIEDEHYDEAGKVETLIR